MKRSIRRGNFLNVDLEVYSDRPLDLFVSALGEAVDVLFLGETRGRYLAALELAGSGWQQEPDPIIMELAKLIRGLPEEARALWNTASERRFDVGCDAPAGPDARSMILSPETVAAIADLNGTVVMTIYPGELRRA